MNNLNILTINKYVTAKAIRFEILKQWYVETLMPNQLKNKTSGNLFNKLESV